MEDGKGPKIIDRRRIIYDRATGDVKYRPGHEQDHDDGLDAYRTASFGDRHVSAAAPSVAHEPDYKAAPASDFGTSYSQKPNYLREEHVARRGVPLWPLLSAGAVIGGIMFVIASGKYQQRPPSPTYQPQTPITQAAPEVETPKVEPVSAPMPVEVEPPAVELNIDTPKFDEYQRQREAKRGEFRRSRFLSGASMRRMDRNEYMGKIGPLLNNTSAWPSQVFGCDINGDGIEEINSDIGVYQERGSGFVKILDKQIHNISDITVNGYPVVYSQERKQLSDYERHIYLFNSEGFIDIITEHSWNGERFEESGRFTRTEDAEPFINAIHTSFVYETPTDTNILLRELGSSLGPDNSLRAFLQFQAPVGFAMPTGSEYVEYVRQYAMELERTNPGMGERALTRYADDPAGFFSAVYGRSAEPVFLDILNPKSIAAVSLGLTLRRFGMGNDFNRHMEYWNRAQGNIGFIAAYRTATGHYPQTNGELWSAMNNVVREDKIPVIVSGRITGDPRYNSLDTEPPWQMKARQMDQETQRALGIAAGQANQAGRAAVGGLIDAVKGAVSGGRGKQ